MKFEISSSLHPAFPSGHPIEVGRSFILVPEGAAADNSDRISIRLSRGKAFGSGLHETTVSCIKAMEELGSLENKSALDVGAGTGILSLAALYLGAQSAAALDIDADAARTCSRNAEINGMGKRLRIYQGTADAVSPAARFDLVMANIHGDIILKQARRLAMLTDEGGHLILSGLDYTDNMQVKEAMNKEELREISVQFLEEYVTQVWLRPPKQDQRGP